MLQQQLELVRAKKGSEKEHALEQRIADLEARFQEKPKEEKEEALEELSDEEWELVRAHRESAAAPPVVEEPPAVEEPPKKMRPGRKSGKVYNWTVDDAGKVQRIDIPTIFSGKDEPDEVELPDEEPEAEAETEEAEESA